VLTTSAAVGVMVFVGKGDVVLEASEDERGLTRSSFVGCEERMSQEVQYVHESEEGN